MPKFKKYVIKPDTGGDLGFKTITTDGSSRSEGGPILSPRSPGYSYSDTARFGDPRNYDIPFVTVYPTPFLQAERALVPGSGISIIDHGPNNNVEIRVNTDELNIALAFEVSGVFITSASRVNFISDTIDLRGSASSGGVFELHLSAPSINLTLSATGTGTGADIFAGVSGGEIIFRPIVGELGISARQTSSSVRILNYWIHANNSWRFPADPYASGVASIAIGHDTRTDANRSIAIGYGVKNPAERAINFGDMNIMAEAPGSVVIGIDNVSRASAAANILIGQANIGFGGGTIAIGTNFDGIGPNFHEPVESLYMFGYGNQTSNTKSVLIGEGNIVSFDGTSAQRFNILIGGYNYQDTTPSIIIGTSSQTFGPGTIAIGNDSNLRTAGAVGVGHNIDVPSSITSAVYVFGRNITVSRGAAVVLGVDNPVLTIATSGEVGINVADPAETVDIWDNDQARIKFATTALASGVYIGLVSGSDVFDIETTSNNGVRIYVNGQSEVLFDRNGVELNIGKFASLGDSRYSVHLVRGTTISAFTRTYLTMPDGSELTLQDNSAWLFEIHTVGKEQGGPNAVGYEHKGIIKRGVGAGTVSFVGTPSEVILGETTSAVNWEAHVEADTTNGRLRIYAIVSGVFSTNPIDWIATVKITEINGI